MELTVAAGDFGISSSGHFRVMDGSGTIAFCAPEQLNSEQQDDRSDVFALGMTTVVCL
jgi:serine/threonine protein kinase